MLKYRHTYIGKGEFKNWMYFLSLNVFNDYQKIQKKNNHSVNIEHYNNIIIDPQPADAQIQRDQQVNMLIVAMKKLSEEERKILVLSQVQKLRYKEIAEILKTTEGAVKVRVHRAFNQLKELYFKTMPYETR
jgi:RNA polymerase sigma-70 factor (ECF subfamily)